MHPKFSNSALPSNVLIISANNSNINYINKNKILIELLKRFQAKEYFAGNNIILKKNKLNFKL
ncbi:hypothetical protein U3516DRAFT_737437 [Neocallimastix sp. 'constans']